MSLLERIHALNPEHVELLEARYLLRAWNTVFFSLRQQVAGLAEHESLFRGASTGPLNIGLLQLPHLYADDRILAEARTSEGDILVATCHFFVIIRNGVDHLSVPLSDYSALRVTTYSAGEALKGTSVCDGRTGQVLLQGTMGFIDTARRTHVHDVFFEAVKALSEVHELLAWMDSRQDELLSLYAVLSAISARLADTSPGESSHHIPSKANHAIAPVESPDDADFEIIE
jgi:hypothetical protein